jgi:hypothetical protein
MGTYPKIHPARTMALLLFHPVLTTVAKLRWLTRVLKSSSFVSAPDI